MTYVPKQSERIGEGDESKFQPRERVGSHLFIPAVIFDLMHEENAPTEDTTTDTNNSYLPAIFEPSGPVLEEMSLKQIKETLSGVRELQAHLASMSTKLSAVARKLEDPLGMRTPAESSFAGLFGISVTPHAGASKEDI